MRRTVAVVLTLLTSTASEANVPPPGEKYLRYYAVITLNEPAGEWVYFAVPSGGYGLRKLGQESQFEISSPGWSGTSTKPSVVVWAVHTGECSGMSDEAYEGRLRDLQQRGLAVCSERIELGYWRGSLVDASDGIEKHYCLQRTETELKLYPLGERTRWSGFSFMVWGSLVAAVTLFAVWLTWMWRRRKVRGSRATPLPGN